MLQAACDVTSSQLWVGVWWRLQVNDHHRNLRSEHLDLQGAHNLTLKWISSCWIRRVAWIRSVKERPSGWWGLVCTYVCLVKGSVPVRFCPESLPVCKHTPSDAAEAHGGCDEAATAEPLVSFNRLIFSFISSSVNLWPLFSFLPTRTKQTVEVPRKFNPKR